MYRILHENRNAVEGVVCCVPDTTDCGNTVVRGITLLLVRVVIRLVQPGLRAILNRVHYRIKLPIELLYPAQCVGGAAVQPAPADGATQSRQWPLTTLSSVDDQT